MTLNLVIVQLLGIVMVARDLSWVTAFLYSRLATSLRSLAIILPIHLDLLSLASTFATGSHQVRYVYLWGRMQAYVALHYYRSFSTGIHFAHKITSWWVYPFFRHATSCSQQFRMPPSKRDIETSLLRSTKSWPFHHSTEPLMAAE